jgi:hypothetical protein
MFYHYQHIGENQEGGKLGKGKIESWIFIFIFLFFYFFLIKGVGTRHGERDSMVGN